MKVMKKATEKMKAKRPHWHRQGKDGPYFKGNNTMEAGPDPDPVTFQKRIQKQVTTHTDKTTTIVIATIKQEEKVGQYLMETTMGAEIRGTARLTSVNTNEMHQRYPIDTVQGRKEWQQHRRSK